MKIFKLVKQNIANIFSLIRIVFIPLLIKTATDETRDSFVLLSVSLFSTDVLDGILARKLKIVSSFGKRLDTVADYLFYSVMIGIIIVMYKDSILQYWFLIITPIFLFSSPKLIGLYFIKRFSTIRFIIWRIAAVVFFSFFLSLIFLKFSLFLLVLLNLICLIGFIEEILIYVVFREQTDNHNTSLLQYLNKRNK